MAMFQELGRLLAAEDALGAASSSLGADEESTHSALSASVPVLLGAMSTRAAKPAGASALLDLIKGQDHSILDNLGGALTSSPSGADEGRSNDLQSSLVDGLLGGNKDRITQVVAEHAGLGSGQIAKLLPMLAPVVLGFLGKRQSEANVDQAGLAASLANERTAMDSAGYGPVLGLLESGDVDQDDRHFLGTLGAVGTAGAIGAVGTAGAVGSGGTTAMRNTTASTATARTGAAAGAAATPLVTHDEERKGAMAKWLIPLLLLGVLGVGLWAAFGRGDDDGATTATADTAATTTQIEEMADEIEEVVEDEVVDEEPEVVEAEEPEPEVAEGYVAGNILEAGQNDGQVSGFLGAVDATGLDAELDGDGPFTIFAPSDEALATLPESITSDPEKLERVLRNHVVAGDYPVEALVDGPLTSLDGSALNVATGSGSPAINGANMADGLAGANGTMYVIDQVLLPADLISSAGGSLNEALGIQPINFEVGSAVITADSTPVLDGAAEFLIANETVVEIAGHTDADGNDASNLALSQERAEAVMAYLTDKGVAAENMTAVGYGETAPIADNDTDEGKADNRRIEFVAAGS